MAGLQAIQPAFPIISEEDDAQSDLGGSEVFWLVDPLDGTKEFIKGLGDYTVNIALIERSRPILGVIYVPAADVLYVAARELGAFKSTAGGQPEPIRDRPWSAGRTFRSRPSSSSRK